MTSSASLDLPAGVEITADIQPGFAEILTRDALALVADLHRKFEPERQRLMAARAVRQARIDAGEMPDFLAETKHIRDGDWTVAPIPADIQDRRVEITGPTDAKMVINALNSGASVFMTDFEDANSPSWSNMVQGQINLRDANLRTLIFDDPKSGKHYELAEKLAVLMVRPRGWHLMEAHMRVDGAPVVGGIFDAALYLFHNHRTLKAQGSGPYFYLPKMQSHLEARLWNSVFVAAQEALGIPNGTIKATVLIEHILAAFELDEILYELRDHMAGLNCGRWDYIFSFIKTFRNHAAFVLPDRGEVTMTVHFLRSYSLLVIKTCHRRKAFAMGGMAAQIPNRRDPEANAIALEKVKADKEREAGDGHDGTWVAHPDLIPVAKEVFDRVMPQANQLAVKRDDVNITAADLLAVPAGSITEAGLRQNINVGILYMEAWLRGTGAVPLYNLMEDAATAEISRTQVWQWLHHGASFTGGGKITPEVFGSIFAEEVANLKEQVGPDAYEKGRYQEAADLFHGLIVADQCSDFLTLPAYEILEK